MRGCEGAGAMELSRCPCADCGNGVPPRCVARNMTDEYVMELHAEYVQMVELVTGASEPQCEIRVDVPSDGDMKDASSNECVSESQTRGTATVHSYAYVVSSRALEHGVGGEESVASSVATGCRAAGDGEATSDARVGKRSKSEQRMRKRCKIVDSVD